MQLNQEKYCAVFECGANADYEPASRPRPVQVALFVVMADVDLDSQPDRDICKKRIGPICPPDDQDGGLAYPSGGKQVQALRVHASHT